MKNLPKARVSLVFHLKTQWNAQHHLQQHYQRYQLMKIHPDSKKFLKEKRKKFQQQRQYEMLIKAGNFLQKISQVIFLIFGTLQNKSSLTTFQPKIQILKRTQQRRQQFPYKQIQKRHSVNQYRLDRPKHELCLDPAIKDMQMQRL